jgi:hypothetical protein
MRLEVINFMLNMKSHEFKLNLFNLRFPWESAYTGLDVTPDCCPEVKLYQLHISGDIAFAGENREKRIEMECFFVFIVKALFSLFSFF